MALNVYQKSLDRNVAVSLSILTIVSGFLAYNLLNEESEESDSVFNNISVNNANNVPMNNANNAAMNNAAMNNANNVVNNVVVNEANNGVNNPVNNDVDTLEES